MQYFSIRLQSFIKAKRIFSVDGVGSQRTQNQDKKFGAENVQIINDDKPIIRFIDNDWYVYGSPFDGGTGINKNIRAKLGGIIFLERAEENSIEVLDKNSIFSRIYKNTIKFSLDDEYAGYMLNTADKLIKENYFYLLKCNMNIDSAEICEKFLTDRDSYVKAEKYLIPETTSDSKKSQTTGFRYYNYVCYFRRNGISRCCGRYFVEGYCGFGG